MELDAVVHDLHDRLGAEGLDPRHLLHVVATGVANPGRVVHRGPHRVEPGLVHRHALADRAEVVEVTAEGGSLLHVGEGLIDRRLRRADAHPDQHHALVLEVLHRLVEPPVHGAEHLGVGHPDVVEHQLRGVRATPAVLVEFLRHREPLGALRHEEHGDPIPVVRVGLRRDDRHVAVDGVGDEGLRAVDPPAVAVANRRGAHPRHIGPGVGLADPDRQDRLTGEHRRHPLLELLGRARVDEVRGRHIGVDQHGHIEAGEGRRAERLGERRRGQHAETEATVLLRGAEPEHAEGTHLVEHLARDLSLGFPGIAVRGHLGGDELDRLVVDRLQFIGHVDVAVHLVSL